MGALEAFDAMVADQNSSMDRMEHAREALADVIPRMKRAIHEAKRRGFNPTVASLGLKELEAFIEYESRSGQISAGEWRVCGVRVIWNLHEPSCIRLFEEHPYCWMLCE